MNPPEMKRANLRKLAGVFNIIWQGSTTAANEQ
jgi:hypothetical protein